MDLIVRKGLLVIYHTYIHNNIDNKVSFIKKLLSFIYLLTFVSKRKKSRMIINHGTNCI